MKPDPTSPSWCPRFNKSGDRIWQGVIIRRLVNGKRVRWMPVLGFRETERPIDRAYHLLFDAKACVDRWHREREAQENRNKSATNTQAKRGHLRLVK